VKRITPGPKPASHISGKRRIEPRELLGGRKSRSGREIARERKEKYLGYFGSTKVSRLATDE